MMTSRPTSTAHDPASVGGTVTVKSGRGAGTEIEAIIPLAGPARLAR